MKDETEPNEEIIEIEEDYEIDEEDEEYHALYQAIYLPTATSYGDHVGVCRRKCLDLDPS